MSISVSVPARLRRAGRRRVAARHLSEESVGGAVAKFALAAFVAVFVIGIGGVIVIRRTASNEVLRDAKGLARLAGNGVVAPHLTPSMLRGDPAALARLDRAVHQRILGHAVVRVKIWTPDGRIVYSDAHRLIGKRYPLGADDLETLKSGRVEAEASDLSRPENRFERGYHRLVEVYLPIRATDGTPLLYEDYERSSALEADTRHRWLSLAPSLIGGLVLLELLLVPLAWSMARRLRDRQRDRVELLRRAVASSDLERRRIAADLHDGPLQRLASLSFDLTSEAEMAGAPSATALHAGADQARDTIRELRALLVDIYPPTLREEGLAFAVGDVAAALSADGTTADVDIPEALDISYEAEALLFRVAQEALRNVRAHSGARHVEVTVRHERGMATLVVADDGRGFAVEGERREGHFGLRLMEDLARDAGGSLTVDSAPGRGTRVTLEVPA